MVDEVRRTVCGGYWWMTAMWWVVDEVRRTVCGGYWWMTAMWWVVDEVCRAGLYVVDTGG